MRAIKNLVLVYLTTLTTITVATESNRHTTRSIHHYTSLESSNYEPKKLSTILNNEFTVEPEKKVNRLMGGHIKVTTESSTTQKEEDEANWDDGLFLSSAGNGKEKKSHDDDDEKKTLAQQVKEGKYGLIQNEIYPKKPKRPGIISYLSNPDVPKDSSKNLGGLDEEEIWLAENHVLVLRGGNFPEQDTEQPTGDLQGWTPIDDFQAPKRQVKIPPKPKVPPPFPVQLTEGGPVEVIGSNDTSSDKPNWFDGLIPLNETFLPPEMNNTQDDQDDKKIKTGSGLGGIVGPFFPSLPPGAVFVPPPGNQSDYDEDDQSIYYPPPYSFKYSQENSTAVPPGPLVPGIILPPPPDFFSQLEEKKTTKSHITKYPKRTNTTPKSENHYSSRKSSLKPNKIISSSTLSIVKEPRPFTMKPVNKFKQKNLTTLYAETVSRESEKTIPFIQVTTSSPNKDSTLEISEINTVRPILTNQVIETNTEDVKPVWNSLNSKSSPIVAYYGSTPSSTVDDPVEVTPVIKTKKPQTAVPSSASYYFYEETNDDTSGTTPMPTIYFQETTPPYKSEERTKKPYYNVDVTSSQRTQEDYSVEVIDPIVRTSPRFYTDPSPQTNIPVSSRSHGQRMIQRTSPIYYSTVTERQPLDLHSFFTTPAPERYNEATKPKPVYQYSFEAADYAQRGRSKQIYKQEVHEQPQKQVTFNEWQEEIQDVGQQYNDYDTEIVPEQRLQPERNNYRSRTPINLQTTTVRTNIVDTTPSSHHTYYTKQDERYLDDVTKEYFTNFGRKIKHNRLSSTTPIYGKTSSVTERPNYPTVNSFVTNSFDDRQKPTYNSPKVKVHYGDQTQRPFSLDSDTRVNYRRPLPPINPDAEFLPGYEPKENEQIISRYRGEKPVRQPYVPVNGYSGQQIIRQPAGPTNFVPLDDGRENGERIFPGRPISLSGDIAVNYRDPRPPINPDAEFIDPEQANGNQEKPSSYFAYRLPGDGGHFYFLTPHAITQRQNGPVYRPFSRPRGSRFARRRRGPGDI